MNGGITLSAALLQAGQIYLITFVISFVVAIIIKLIFVSIKLFHKERQQ